MLFRPVGQEALASALGRLIATKEEDVKELMKKVAKYDIDVYPLNKRPVFEFFSIVKFSKPGPLGLEVQIVAHCVPQVAEIPPAEHLLS